MSYRLSRKVITSHHLNEKVSPTLVYYDGIHYFCDMDNLTDLTPDQQKAFNRLKKAYKDCDKLGILFVNRYSELYAFDSKKISGFGDDRILAEGVEERSVYEITGGNSISIVSEWCDDDGLHFYGLTSKGVKLFNEGSI